MTSLARILELLATADKLHVEITKYSHCSYFVRVNDMDDVHALGIGQSLEAACGLAEFNAINMGLMPEAKETDNG